MQGQLPSMTDSVLNYNDMDVGMLAVADEELTQEYAAMAEEENDKGPLTGINYRELYSFRTRQATRKLTDQPAKRCRLSTSRSVLGASRGAYDASDEVINKFARDKTTGERTTPLSGSDHHDQPSTSRHGTRVPTIRKNWWLTARSSYVLYLKAARHMRMDAQSQQQALAELVEK